MSEPDTYRPVVLITPDLIEADGEDMEATYVVRANYAEAITEAGGLALFVPFETAQIDEAFRLADGVVISGSEPGSGVSSVRIAFERKLIARTLAAPKPLLGICHGMQLIGEHLGGTITRDDPALAAVESRHIPNPTAQAIAHPIEVAAGSMLSQWAGERTFVNSFHRHALSEEGRYRVAARAPDGIVEAIEGLGAGFCLGVQWHPEYRLSPLDRAILESFVARCGVRHKASRKVASKVA
jgi:gamma-glutamyl-gamma-aminobutyrate hydrolase PuuD